MPRSQLTPVAKGAVLLLVWYSSSSLAGVFVKKSMLLLPLPMTVYLVQLLVANLVVPILIAVGGHSVRSLSRAQYVRWIAPLAALKTFASVSTHLSIMKASLAYAHTVKALMPLFAVALARMILGTRHSTLTYLSLFPIVLGVLVTSVTQVDFDLVGMGCALVACAAFALQSMLSKQAISKYKLEPLPVLQMVSRCALALLLPIWLYADGTAVWTGQATLGLSGKEQDALLFYLLAAGITNSAQTVAAFHFLSLVSPVTYAIANVSKRVVIILCALVFFWTPIGLANACGMALTLTGIACYNKVKFDENKRKAHALIAPVAQSM